ncbi:MAG TPA: ABC transporter permease [Gammaproteobacteria bacterium]|nr:ABC transporter permease [Gammaproteobacteria bacterium]
MQTLAQDVRYALRALRRNKGFAAVTIAILALGIGANTAIFSLVSAVLLKPLPFPEPERLMLLWEDASSIGGPSRVEVAPADFVDWRERNRSFEGIAALENRSYNLTGGGEPEKVEGVGASANLFALLGMRALVGRTLLPDDGATEAAPVVAIGERLWRRRFGADPGVVGRTIDLDGEPRTVVGVVPPYFQFPNKDANVWVPLKLTAEQRAARNNYYLYVVGRLASGATREQAQSDLATIAAAIHADNPELRLSATVASLHEHLSRDARPTLTILLAAVAAVLLITCANVANLLLARGASRAKELAVRKALGAASARVLRQLFTESGVIAILGVAVGIGLSTASSGYLARLVPATYPGGAAPALDWRVLAFAVAITLVTVLLFGAAPAVTAARASFNDTLKKSVGATSRPHAGRVRNALVVAEITFTVVLLTAAMLLLRSYAGLLAVDPGFVPQRLLIAETDLSPAKYADAARRSAFYAAVIERVSALPGVTTAGYASFAPLTFKGGRALLTIEGRPPPPPADATRNMASDRVVAGDYFRTLGVPLVAGRLFDSRDTNDAPGAVIVNQALARRQWPGEDAIGKRFTFGPPGSPWLTVIGVVGDVRQMALDAEPEPEFFLFANQTGAVGPFLWPRHLVVRAQNDSVALAAAVRDAVWSVDAEQPVSNIRGMSEVLDVELSSRNTQLTLVAALAALALLLAGAGLYGVLSYTVAQRGPEIGLRMALGARRSSVVRSVLRSAASLAALGLVLGVLGALAATRLIGSFLFGVGSTDPATYAAVAAAIALVTLLAAYVPARRAASVDPMTALRVD